MIWARDISSAYPDEGVRLPYHRYLTDPERLAEIALFPENPFLCKYGSKHLTDDDAIGLLEQSWRKYDCSKPSTMKQRTGASEKPGCLKSSLSYGSIADFIRDC